MQITDRYLRDGLTATREGRAHPDSLVVGWVDSLQRALAATPSAGSAADDATMLIDWARLRRVRPELLPVVAESLLAQAERIGDALGVQALREAVAGVEPGGWLERARQLSASYDQMPDAPAQEHMAKTLIEGLDEAELLFYAAAYFSRGRLESYPNHPLEPCREWLRQNVADFLPAAEDAQTAGAAIRPDLPEWDPMLAMTAEKFIWLLDDAEDAEAEYTAIGGPLFDAAALRALVAQEPDAAARSATATSTWLPEAPYALAASPDEVARSYPAYRWVSPDGSAVAWLTISPVLRGTDDERLCVEFRERGPAGVAAARLAGTRVVLAGTEACIDANGMVQFRLGDLRAGESTDPVLEVGDPPVSWSFQPISDTSK